jgi:antitoxin HicB
MLAYPCRFEADDEGFAVTCRDVEDMVTWGDSLEEAMAMAQDAIGTLLSTAKGPAAWPAPSPSRSGERIVVLPARLVAKAALWASLEEQSLTKSELARRLGVDEKEVRRLVSFKHPSRIDRLESALHALGKELVVEVREAA